MAKTNNKEKKTMKIEWAFEPTLGFDLESVLTKEEIEELLTLLSVSTQEISDSEKKETSE